MSTHRTGPGHAARPRQPERTLAALASLLCSAALGAGCDETDPASATPSPDSPAPAASTASASGAPSATATATVDAGTDAPPEPDCAEYAAKWGEHDRWPGTFEEQNQLLLDQLECVHQLGTAAMAPLREMFGKAKRMGQGNPAVARHPVTVAQCQEGLRRRGETFRVPDHERICGAKYMAPLYDPKTQKPGQAKACIDLFEFPNIPCTYPVTWVRANEAAEICTALGKRICDAHEWEGACAGQVLPPDYDFDRVKNKKHKEAVKTMRSLHNGRIEKTKRWAYGDEYRKGVCATSSKKSKDCGVGWRKCGTNTFPSGHFPDCKSPLGVYDQHGNAAEHMNLPLIADHMASGPNDRLGVTEMKGSWFVFDQIRAHQDHCRWRAPFWHGTRIRNENSHRNYHLGFRCCKTVGD
ncbi:MAG: SUMF1/EgtB/PvdO family nonheme iron enzyme [Deltaproteobacteria bacterium]|nr:SUMF1/EgtB/PvdO family nonheme iron enzyme [Deltaproteobacteria bacterium]MBW2537553.1 SUMF1/EgtB/PvdO family nonheme iron enzyme [Deltaproteobacteria bacterium]